MWFYVATSGRALPLLKVKALGKRKLKDRMVFPTDLAAFADPPRRRMRRLIPPSDHPHSRRERPRDQIMQDEEEEKKSDE